jgi:hypothetical protein
MKKMGKSRNEVHYRPKGRQDPGRPFTRWELIAAGTGHQPNFRIRRGAEEKKEKKGRRIRRRRRRKGIYYLLKNGMNYGTRGSLTVLLDGYIQG